MYKAPYQISIWDTSTSPETKICNIGSDKMTISARALEPKLQRNINGKMSFSFRMYKECYDIDIGDVTTYLVDRDQLYLLTKEGEDLYLIVQALRNRDYTGKYNNPFLPYLINERVIKVKWEDDWYDFVIKNIQEDSAAKSYTFQCESWLVQELSKQGFNLEFDEKLQNNQDTIDILAQDILKDTAWQLGTVDIGYEYNKESAYEVQVPGQFTFLKLPGYEPETVTNGRALVFFSCISGLPQKDGETVLQFIYTPSDSFVTEQNSQMVKDSETMNYQVNVTYEYSQTNKFYNFYVNDVLFCTIDPAQGVSPKYRAKRLVNSIKTIYDPLVDKYCSLLLQGAPHRLYTKDESEFIPLYAKIGDSIIPIYSPSRDGNQVKYREFKDTDYNFARYIQNLISNGVTFTSSEGWRHVTKTTEIVDDEEKTTYTQDDLMPRVDSQNVKSYMEVPLSTTDNDWIFNSSIRSSRSFVKTFIREEIYYFRVKMKKDGDNWVKPPFTDVKIAQYEDYNIFYPTSETYFTQDAEDWSDPDKDGFCIMPLKCIKPLNLESVVDARAGLFFHCTINEVQIEEAQLFKEMKDEDGNILTPASFDASGVVKDYYCVYKETAPMPTSADQINFEYKGDKKITEARPSAGIEYVTNNIQKVRTISGKESNRFNLLQTLAEKFECWCIIRATHDETTGVITGRYVDFKETVGEDQNIGFIYGLDLKSVKRTVDSKQIVTKTIVKTNSNKYGTNCFCTIARAPENYPKVNYILDFGQYVNQGLIDNAALNQTLYGAEDGYFVKLHEYNEAYDAAANEYEKYKLQYDNLGSYLKVFESYKENAESQKYQYMLYLFNLGDNFVDDTSNDSLQDLWDRAHGDDPEDAVYQWYMKYVNDAREAELRDETAENAIKYDDAITAAINGEKKFDDQIANMKASMYGHLIYDYNGDGKVDADDVELLQKYLAGWQISFPNWAVLDVDGNGEVDDWDEVVLTQLIAKKDKKLETRASDGLDSKIATAEATMKAELELIAAADLQFQTEYGAFIQEGTWSSEDYYNDTKYYLDGLDVAYTSARPRITYSIDVLRLNGLPEFKNKVFKLGDIAYVEDTEFFGYTVVNNIKTPYHEKVVLTELTQNFDDASKDQFKVQNYRTQFEDLFQRITASVQSLQWNEADYGRAVDAVQKDETINTDILQSSLNNAQNLVRNSLNNAITQDATGISIINQNDPSKQSHINAEGFFISTDGGDNWRNAVSAEGIATELLTAGSIDTNRISIMDGNTQAFRWDASGLNAYKTQSTGQNGGTYGTFVRFDKWGIYGRESTESDFKPTDEQTIWNQSKTKFALTWSGLNINSNQGNTSLIAGTIPNTNQDFGLSITKNTVENGVITNREKVFYADSEGNLTLKGAIEANSGYIGGNNGFVIEEHKLSTKYTIDLTDYYAGIYNGGGQSGKVFYAGATDTTGTDAVFSVTAAGVVEMPSGHIGGNVQIDGTVKVKALEVLKANTTDEYLFKADADAHMVEIGGWTVKENALYTDNNNLYLGTEGINAQIGGTQRTDLVFKAGSNFGVTNDGTLYANNAVISGTINANQGEIAGWKINSTSLSSPNGQTYISSSGNYAFRAGNIWITHGGNITTGGAIESQYYSTTGSLMRTGTLNYGELTFINYNPNRVQASKIQFGNMFQSGSNHMVFGTIEIGTGSSATIKNLAINTTTWNIEAI